MKYLMFGKKYGSLLLAIFLVAGMLFSSTGIVHAAEFDDDGTIASGDTINDDVFLTGEDVVVDGTVIGTVFAFGNTVTINGKIDGDLITSGMVVKITEGAEVTGNIYAGGQLVEFDSTVEGSLFAGATIVRLGENAVVERNVFAGAYDISTGENSTINRDLFAGAYQVLLAGKIDRDAQVASAALDVEGQIGRNLIVDVASPNDTDISFGSPFSFYQPGVEIPKQRDPGLRISESAEIVGNLQYTSSSEQENAILAAPQGEVIYQTPVPEEQTQYDQPETNVHVRAPGFGFGIFFRWITGIFRNFVTLLILGGLALWLVPASLQMPAGYLRTKPWHSLGYGAASFFGGYLAVVVVAIVLLLVGLFFAIITLGGISNILFGVGYAALALISTVFHFLVWYGSKLVLAFLIGDLIMGAIAPRSTYRKALALLIGVTIVVILRGLPIIGGWLINPLMAVFGIGAICLYLINLRRKAPVLASTVDPEIAVDPEVNSGEAE